MEVSAIARGFQIFSGLGAVATTPFAVQLANKQLDNLPKRNIREVKEEVQSILPVLPIQEEMAEELNPKDVFQEVEKIINKNGDGEKPICFWLPNQPWLEFLMCVSEGKLDSPLLFHYDVWNNLRQGRKVKQVESISFSTSPATMKFTNGETVNLTRTARLYLTTQSQLHKKRATLIPKSQCKIVEKVLTCSDSQHEIFRGGVVLESLHKNKYQELTSK